MNIRNHPLANEPAIKKAYIQEYRRAAIELAKAQARKDAAQGCTRTLHLFCSC